MVIKVFEIFLSAMQTSYQVFTRPVLNQNLLAPKCEFVGQYSKTCVKGLLKIRQNKDLNDIW